MEQKTGKKIFLGQIQRLPNRRKYQTRNTDLEVNLDLVFEKGPLNLIVADIPKQLWFQCILGISLTTERDEGVIYYTDEQVWNLEDEETKRKIERIKELFRWHGHHEDLSLLQRSTLLEYANSTEPNLWKL